ncbi:MAG: hypothetical protein P5702_22650 [Limnospira sp. PMC 1291.21]|uniref:Uncharacterized protein n=1 Tax=Limnospira fusiformis PMC 851.14 TaxID=2219512 RepID=A0ABU9ET49_LIMFS|nr:MULTISPECIES: hypothetical protein [Limnospira]EKD11142.1 hypothetical protein SPLC1_S041390 [Arthrospira platensis C1]MDC0837597.1 hypothetical protein [Limnoraphis robusta]MDT9241688.1 hypothetical protein [Limnospira sp. PMC 1261.20]MDY7051879.1 hypothetical protein [Limnospira fusiformis LS22]QJB27816.1 hypothetical protein HFV01_21065 [Limnospira fusiformis SAG 85.79]
MSTSWAIVVAKDCDRLDLIVSHFGPTSALTLHISQKSPKLSRLCLTGCLLSRNWV